MIIIWLPNDCQMIEKWLFSAIEIFNLQKTNLFTSAIQKYKMDTNATAVVLLKKQSVPVTIINHLQSSDRHEIYMSYIQDNKT